MRTNVRKGNLAEIGPDSLEAVRSTEELALRKVRAVQDTARLYR